MIARVPFDEGSLTGTLTRDMTWPDGDFRNAYFTAANLRETVDRVERLKTTLPGGSDLPSIALRFVLSHPAVVTTIPGMRHVRHVEKNVSAAEDGGLSLELHSALRAHRWDRSSVIL